MTTPDDEAPLNHWAFVFDLDGTIADTEPLAKQAWAQALSRYGRTLDPETVEAMFGLRLLESSVLVRNRFGLAVSPQALGRQRDEAFFALVRGRLEPMCGARELLEALASRGVACAVATSGHSRHAAEVLRELGLEGFFSVVVTGDQVLRGKPEPDIFALAAQRLATPPSRCWAVEDAPNGVESARRAGMRVILVPNAMTAALEFPEVDVRVRDLHELARALPGLVGRGPDPATGTVRARATPRTPG